MANVIRPEPGVVNDKGQVVPQALNDLLVKIIAALNAGGGGGGGGGAEIVLTDASTITPAGANDFYLLTTNAIGASRNMALPTGLVAGTGFVNVEVKQPATGGPCAIVWASGYKWGPGGQDPQPNTSAVNGASDFFSFVVQQDGNLHGVMIGQSGPPGPAGATGPGGSSNFAGTSTTSNTVGIGSLTFTTQAGLAVNVGARLRISSHATPANYVEGVTTAYSGTSLTILSDAIGGSGTFAVWDLNIAGQPGTVSVRYAAVTGNNAANITTTSVTPTLADVTGMSGSIAASVGDRVRAVFTCSLVSSVASQSPTVAFKVNATDLATQRQQTTYIAGGGGSAQAFVARMSIVVAAGDLSGGSVPIQVRFMNQVAATLTVLNTAGVNPGLDIENFGP